jgi:hypothetical protein
MKTGWFGTELCKTMSKKGHAVQTSFSIYQNSPKFEFKGTECMEELEKRTILTVIMLIIGSKHGNTSYFVTTINNEIMD